MSTNPKQEPIDNTLDTHAVISGLDSNRNSFILPQMSGMMVPGRNSFNANDPSLLTRNPSFSGLPTALLPYATDSSNTNNPLLSPIDDNNSNNNLEMPPLGDNPPTPKADNNNNNINNNNNNNNNNQQQLGFLFTPQNNLASLAGANPFDTGNNDLNNEQQQMFMSQQQQQLQQQIQQQLDMNQFNMSQYNLQQQFNNMNQLPPMIGQVVSSYSPEHIQRKRRRRTIDFNGCDTENVKGNAQTGYRMILEEPSHKDMLSCHQCKNKKKLTDIIICGHVFMVKNVMKTCTKKYCTSCLLRFYLESPITNVNDPSWPLWKCPCCRFICCCAWCRKKKAKRMSTAASAIRGNAHRLTPSTSLARKLVTETGLEDEENINNNNNNNNNNKINTSHLLPPPIPQELLDSVNQKEEKIQIEQKIEDTKQNIINNNQNTDNNIPQ